MKGKNVGQYLFFGVLYLAQGIPGGFVKATLVAHLYASWLDAGGKEIFARGGAFISVIGLPWVMKFLWGPVIDRFGRRIQWVIGSSMLMTMMVLLLPLADRSYFWLIVVAFAHELALSFQDVATDGLAIESLDEKQRGPAQSAMKIGHFLGQMIGGAGTLYLSTKLPWWAVCVLVAILVIVTGIMIPLRLWRRVALKAQTRSAFPGWRGFFGVFKSRNVLLGALIGILAYQAQSITNVVFYPWYRNVLKYGDEWIALIQTFNEGFKIGGVLLAGILATKLSRKTAVITAVIVISLAYSQIGLLSGYWTSRWLVFGLVLCTSVADGLYMVLLWTLLMDLTDRRAGATQFALFMAICNLSARLNAWVGGQLGEHLPITAVFLLGGMLQLLVILPLMFVRLGEEKSTG